MSGEAFGWARRASCSGGISAKAVLLLLADYAAPHDDDLDHTAWPSVPRMARELEASERTVQRALDTLIGDGLVEREFRTSLTGRQTSSLYRITFKHDAAEGCQSDTPRGDNLTPLGVTDCHPHPVNLSPLEPLKEPQEETEESSDELSGARASLAAFDRVSEDWAKIAPDRVARPVDLRAWREQEAAGASAAELAHAATRYLAESDDVRRQRVPRLSLWLTQERWRGYLAEAKAAEAKAAELAVDCPSWLGELVVSRKGEAYAASWLAGCRWDEDRRALLTRTGVAADRLRLDLGAELELAGVATIEKG